MSMPVIALGRQFGSMNRIITIGRQFGSGGREIGRKLAEQLTCPFYDRELISLAAKRAEVREELFAGKDEKAGNPWLFTGVYEGGSLVRRGRSAEDILFEMQSQVIVELAEQGPCIIVGRCADHVLRQAGVPVCPSPGGWPTGWRLRAYRKLRPQTRCAGWTSSGENTTPHTPAGTGVFRKTTICASTPRYWALKVRPRLCGSI